MDAGWLMTGQNRWVGCWAATRSVVLLGQDGDWLTVAVRCEGSADGRFVHHLRGRIAFRRLNECPGRAFYKCGITGSHSTKDFVLRLTMGAIIAMRPDPNAAGVVYGTYACYRLTIFFNQNKSISVSHGPRTRMTISSYQSLRCYSITDLRIP